MSQQKRPYDTAQFVLLDQSKILDSIPKASLYCLPIGHICLVIATSLAAAFHINWPLGASSTVPSKYLLDITTTLHKYCPTLPVVSELLAVIICGTMAMKGGKKTLICFSYVNLFTHHLVYISPHGKPSQKQLVHTSRKPSYYIQRNSTRVK